MSDGSQTVIPMISDENGIAALEWLVKASDATILSEIEDGPPGREYRAEDFEGHRWFFLERANGTGGDAHG